MSTRTAIDYELAGRCPSQTFKDLRSASKARRRHRANLEKYYSYRGVNIGQIGQPHHQLPTDIFEDMVLPSEAPIVDMTKQALYYEAQCYPRPPTYHHRPREYAYWPKTCRKEKQRHARRHAIQSLQDDTEEARDPYFLAYVVGHGNERDLDDHIFRRCDVCWPELQGWYVKDEMFDCNGESVGQWEDSWEVDIGDVRVGDRFGFAGRAKVGAVFVMGSKDWRCWPDIVRAWPTRWGFEENDRDGDGEYEADNMVQDVAYDNRSEASDWDVVDDPNDDWEVLSSCSSWSCISA